MYTEAQGPWTRYTETSATPQSSPVHTRNENGESTITRTFSSEIRRGSGRPPSFRASTAAVAETQSICISPSQRPRGRRGLDREFRERFGLTIEERTADADPALVVAHGTRLERLSRRQLEKDVAPWYAIPHKSGALIQRSSTLGARTKRIFEVAAAGAARTAGTERGSGSSSPSRSASSPAIKGGRDL